MGDGPTLGQSQTLSIQRLEPLLDAGATKGALEVAQSVMRSKAFCLKLGGVAGTYSPSSMGVQSITFCAVCRFAVQPM